MKINSKIIQILIIFILNFQYFLFQSIILPQNLIVNSDFQDNKCDQNYCVWNQERYYDYVRGWQPKPKIQVGDADIYVNYFVSQPQKVIMLRQNRCIVQKIPKIQPGQLALTIRWAVKKRKNNFFNKGSIQIYKNSQLISNQTTWNTFTQTKYTTNITNSEGCQLFQIKICGENSVLIYVQLIGTPIVKNTVNVPDQPFSGFSNPVTTINLLTYECVQKIFTLYKDFYELSFSYKAFGVSHRFLSHIIIYWNGVIISIRTPIDQMKYFLKFQVNAIQGVNSLKFCPSSWFLSVVFFILLGIKFKNWDTVDGSSAQSSYGYHYDDQLPYSFVFNLVVYWKDVCVSQNISNLNSGNYVLQMDWIGDNANLRNNDFNISIQNNLITRINVTDYKFNHEIVYFRLNQNYTNPKIKVCGCGNGTWQGTHIDNVKLFYIDS